MSLGLNETETLRSCGERLNATDSLLESYIQLILAVLNFALALIVVVKVVANIFVILTY